MTLNCQHRICPTLMGCTAVNCDAQMGVTFGVMYLMLLLSSQFGHTKRTRLAVFRVEGRHTLMLAFLLFPQRILPPKGSTDNL